MLAKQLKWFHLWGIGVGIVIGAAYFGWNYALAEANLFTFMFATLIAGGFYLASIFCSLKLVLFYPRCGGQFEYAHQLTNSYFSSIICVAGVIVFAVGSASLAAATGAFFQTLNPTLNPKLIATVTILIFSALNLSKISVSSFFQLLITLIATALVVVFIALNLQFCKLSNLSLLLAPNNFPAISLTTILAAIPYGIWLFSGVEFIAMGSEEAKSSAREIPKAYISSILTLLIINFALIFVASTSYISPKLATSDAPLLIILQANFANYGWLISGFMLLSLSGILCSLNGDIFAGSRCIVSAARHGYLPQIFATTHNSRNTPTYAVILIGLLQLICLYFLDLNQLVYATVFCVVILQFSNLVCILVSKFSYCHKETRAQIVPPRWLLLTTLILFMVIFVSLYIQQSKMFWFTCVVLLVGGTLVYLHKKRHSINIFT